MVQRNNCPNLSMSVGPRGSVDPGERPDFSMHRMVYHKLRPIFSCFDISIISYLTFLVFFYFPASVKY